MTIEREDFFCDSCHTEFIIDMTLHEDISEEDIKHCPFCGAAYDNELTLSEPKFTDEYDEFDE